LKTASNVPNAQDRNIGLLDIAQVLNKPGIQLVSLQYGDVSDEISNLKTKFGISVTQVSDVDNKNDIDGLASLISACDEVVSTTNVTVHLAGALGADVSVLLPFVPRWIWGKPNSPSTWYRSVKPYRQSTVGEWDNVLRLLRNVFL
jgi:ADP-heptose:LPS heptosyltransferase